MAYVFSLSLYIYISIHVLYAFLGVFMYVHIHVHAQIVVGYIDTNSLSPSLGKCGGRDSSHLYLLVRKL